MVSTPENGVDSIALTYSLMDPIMTVIRPVAGFFTGVVAGIMENLTGKPDVQTKVLPENPLSGRLTSTSMKPLKGFSNISRPRFILNEVIQGQLYSFGSLFNDLAKWYLLGALLAGLVTITIPADQFAAVFQTGIWSYLAMLILGLPIYVCATFSTPVAAALVAKGLSPGAALVFLLAGPATNVATISMLYGLMGRRSVLVYVFSIIACSLGFAFLTDFTYYMLKISPSSNINISHEGIIPHWLEMLSAFVMICLCSRAIFFNKGPR